MLNGQIKRYIIILLVILGSSIAKSQEDTLVTEGFNFYNQGKNLFGAQPAVGFGGGGLVGSFYFRYGRYFIDKLAAGIATKYTTTGLWYKEVSGGPFVRYYLLNKKFSPFMEANYKFGISKHRGGASLNEEWTSDLHSVNTGIGLAYTGIFKRFGVEFHLGYRFLHFRSKDFPNVGEHNYNAGQPAYGIRINYHFKIT